jgi:DNA ligase-1
MLAQTADDVNDALARHSPAIVETKFDGARVQVHKDGDQIWVFTRRLRDVTADLPDVVASAHLVTSDQAILDGEAIALDEQKRPLPFQVTMSRFGSAATDRPDVALSVFFFDVLLLDGEETISVPASERWGLVTTAVPADMLPPRAVVGDAAAAADFLEQAIAAGHEGIMVKDPEAPYAAGRRRAGWLKVKPAHTLDLVVLAVEWGSGRRQGWLSNLHLGARDPDTGGFVMLGKTFKGLTDQMLEWQTERFLALETSRERHVIHVKPEQVVEIAFDGVQASPRYPSGMALRFARVKGYRDDKPAAEADTVGRVRAIFDRSRASGSGPEPTS